MKIQQSWIIVRNLSCLSNFEYIDEDMLTIMNNCNVYEEMSQSANILGQIKKGEFVKFKGIKKKGKIIWYELINDNFSGGFINARHVYQWEKGIVTSNNSYLIPQGKDFENKIELNRFSIVRLIRPPSKNKSYKIETKNGHIGIVPKDFKIMELLWFFLYIIYTTVFVSTLLIFFTTAISFGMKRGGVFFSVLAAAGIAFGVTIVVMLLSFIIKTIFFEIKIRG